MFDPSALALAGVNLLVLVFGLVEFFKSLFNLSGKAVTILSASMGALLAALYQLIPLLPDNFEQVVNIVITSITVGLAASGFYKFTNARMERRGLSKPAPKPVK